ncbi:hypothetical protein VTL71DRAFT_13933 [Oculimacula yallundae]|uniref:Uncharacterized protein n=1 Tax=Oculimacula yallundae TaxID=86028 RepID=A0ABR4CN20_9HELO
MSQINADMESLTMSKVDFGKSRMPARISDIVDLTLSDDDEDDSGSDSGLEQNDNVDESNNDSDIEMLDGPPPIFRNPSQDESARAQSDAPLPDGLPPGIEWPSILIGGPAQRKRLITRQFVKPETYALRLDAANPRVRFTVPQYKLAWVYAVNQCRDKVDLTTTFATYPGLDEAGFRTLINNQFDAVLDRVKTSYLQTRAEKLRDIQYKIEHTPVRNGKKHKGFRRKEMMLSTPGFETEMPKAEKLTSRDPIERLIKVPGDVYDNKRRGEVQKPDGSWGTAANTLPLAFNRMAKAETNDHAPSLSAVRETRHERSVPAPTLTSASNWYTPSNSSPIVSQKLHIKEEKVDGHTSFEPYTPLNFLGTSTRFSSEQAMVLDSHYLEDEPPRQVLPRPGKYIPPHLRSPGPDSSQIAQPQNTTHESAAQPLSPKQLTPQPGHLPPCSSPSSAIFTPNDRYPLNASLLPPPPPMMGSTQTTTSTNQLPLFASPGSTPSSHYPLNASLLPPPPTLSSTPTSTSTNQLPLFASRGTTSWKLDKKPPSYPIMSIPPGTPTGPRGETFVSESRTEELLPESRDEHFKYYVFKDEAESDE